MFFVSDIFVDKYIGGAELTSEAIITNSYCDIKKVESSAVTVKFLEDNKEDTIIILQADHGTRYLLDWEFPLSNEEAIRERLSILSAFYFYDGNYSEMDDYITPVNIFRKIFNTYVDGDFEILENRNYFLTNQTSLVFVDVTDIMK